MPRIELTELERQKLAKAGADSISGQHGWRPIDTAPNDGTPFIGISVFEAGSAEVAIVMKDNNLPNKMWRCCASATIFRSGNKYGQSIDIAFPFLTHWKPLDIPSQDEQK
jgi:hypothetical protein